MDELRKEGSLPRAVVLLTDGLPNTRPEGGEVEALRKMKRLEKDVSDITVHTFGFGYSLDDEVLDGLASEAGGIFAFVPDAGMVGTTFTNLSASLRASAASDARLDDLPLGDLRRGEAKTRARGEPREAGPDGPARRARARDRRRPHGDRRRPALRGGRALPHAAHRAGISPPPAEMVSFQPGDRIEAQFQGRQQWYAGTISRATATGYDVDYDDGDKEQNVSVTLIRSQVTDAWAPTRRVCAELAVEESANARPAPAIWSGRRLPRPPRPRRSRWRRPTTRAMRCGRWPARMRGGTRWEAASAAGAASLRAAHRAGVVAAEGGSNERGLRIGWFGRYRCGGESRIAGRGIMDLEGQVKIATSSQREWKRWGRYYCRSLASVGARGTCHNFKDQTCSTAPGLSRRISGRC